MKKTEKSNTNEIIEIPAEEAPYALPDGWKWVRLGMVANWGSGGTPSRRVGEYYNGQIPWVKTGELNNNYIFDTEEHISEDAIKNSSAKLYPINTVLLAMYGATIGKVAILGVKSTTNQACACGVCKENIFYKFLFYYLRLSKEAFINMAKGGAQPNISQEMIKKYIIPLPPLETQQRIVDRIESLFAKLDEAKEKAQTALDTFELRKSAILHKAFTGELTAQWRSSCRASGTSNASAHIESAPADISSSAPAEHIDNTSSASVEHLNSVSSVPIEDSNNIVSVPIKDPNNELSIPSEDSNNIVSVSTEHTENIFGDLPFSWKIKPLSSVCKSIFDGDHQPPPKSENGVPFIFISNVNKGVLIFDDCSYVSQEYYDSLKDTRKPEYGDVLYTLVGSYGIPVVVDKTQAFCFQRHMALLKPKSIDTYFLWYQLQTSRVFNEATKIATGTAQLTVPIKGLRELQIIVPPLPEQQEIVRILDELLAKENAAKEAAEAVIEKIDLMKKSILARAFRGEL